MKPKASREELAERFGIATKTVTRWNAIGKQPGNVAPPWDKPEKMADWLRAYTDSPSMPSITALAMTGSCVPVTAQEESAEEPGEVEEKDYHYDSLRAGAVAVWEYWKGELDDGTREHNKGKIAAASGELLKAGEALRKIEASAHKIKSDAGETVSISEVRRSVSEAFGDIVSLMVQTITECAIDCGMDTAKAEELGELAANRISLKINLEL